MPNTTYPRVIGAAIAAALAAGSIGAYAISSFLVPTIRSGDVYATSTVGAPTVNATTTNATTGNITTLNATGTRIGHASKRIGVVNAATSTVNPDSLTAGSCTSTSITASGAVAGAGVIPIIPSGWLDLDQIITISAGSDALTVNQCNASTTAVNLGSADVGGWWLQQ